MTTATAPAPPAGAAGSRVRPAGGPTSGDYVCLGCGYGISSFSELPACPMCHDGWWAPVPMRARRGPSRLAA